MNKRKGFLLMSSPFISKYLKSTQFFYPFLFMLVLKLKFFQLKQKSFVSLKLEHLTQ